MNYATRGGKTVGGRGAKSTKFLDVALGTFEYDTWPKYTENDQKSVPNILVYVQNKSRTYSI